MFVLCVWLTVTSEMLCLRSILFLFVSIWLKFLGHTRLWSMVLFQKVLQMQRTISIISRGIIAWYGSAQCTLTNYCRKHSQTILSCNLLLNCSYATAYIIDFHPSTFHDTRRWYTNLHSTENIPNVTVGPLNYAFKRISRKSTVRKDKYKCNGFVYILQVIQQNVDCCCCTTATQPIQMPIAQLIVIGNVAAATKIIISEWSGLITFGRSLVLAALTDRNFSQVAIWLGMIAFQLRTTPTTLSRVHQHKHQLWCGV